MNASIKAKRNVRLSALMFFVEKNAVSCKPADQPFQLDRVGGLRNPWVFACATSKSETNKTCRVFAGMSLVSAGCENPRYLFGVATLVTLL